MLRPVSPARLERKAKALTMATRGPVNSRIVQHRLGVCERTAERYLLELMDEGLLTRQRHSFLYQYRLTDVGREKIAA